MTKRKKYIRSKAEISENPFGLKKDINYRLMFPVIIFIIAFALFSRTIPYDMVKCDDDFMILENQEFNKEISNVFASFDRTFFADDVYYRPILNISFIIDYQIAGLDVWIYRFTNVLYHAISSVLLFFLFIKMRFRIEYSFLFAMLFVVHPLISPATTWIAGRNDSLLAIFILLSFITLINYKESKADKKWRYLILHFFVYALSLYTKETAALSPFLMAGYLLFLRKKEKFFSNENIYLAIGWVLIGIIWFFQRQAVVSEAIGSGKLQLSLAESFVENIPSFIAYISKTFVPVRMSPLANYEVITIIIGILAIAGIALYLIMNKKADKKVILFGFLWYLFFIVPSMLARIRDFDFDYAEHRVYIPIIGIFIIIIEILRSQKISFKRPLEIAVFSIIFIFFTAKTIAYQGNFSDPVQFWGHFIKTYPGKTRGYIGVGKYYFEKKDYDKVEKIMKKGISVKPDFKYWYTNLSTISMQRQNYELAEKYARRSIELDENEFLALKNLAYSLGAQGDFKEAVPYLEKAVNIAEKPDLQMLSRLADAYFRAGYTDAAIRAYDHIISLYPRNLDAYFELAKVYSETGKYEEALQIYNNLQKIAPDSLKVYVNLGTFYAQQNMHEKAEKAWLKATEIDPKNQQAFLNLIQLYVYMDNIEKARSFANIYMEKGGRIPEKIMKMLN